MPAPRIAPLAAPYAPDIARLLASYMPPDSDIEPLGLFRTLAVHEELASRMRSASTTNSCSSSWSSPAGIG